jgi:adenylate cyclase class IV
MHNVEFKAELRDLPLAQAICRRLGATHAGQMRQLDTYYRVPSGRLKRRETTHAAEPGQTEVEYIFYDRADRPAPRLSHYIIYDEPTARERFGVRPLPVEVSVAKTRTLFITGPVRIHLDEVDGLGRFIEFEAVVSRAHPVQRCHDLVAQLRDAFLPVLGEAISVGYADLLRLELESAAPLRRDAAGGGESA